VNHWQTLTRELVRSSGLTERDFAGLVGVPQATFNQNVRLPRKLEQSEAFYTRVVQSYHAKKGETLPVVDKTPVLKTALWVGGPPGKTLDKIRKRLRMDGIDLREQTYDAVKPPVWADLVIINRDMTSHTTHDQQKVFCRDAGVMFVIGSLSYTVMRQNLHRFGYVDAIPPPDLTLEDPEEKETPVDPKADLEPQKQQLRAFLENLPPALRSVALETNTRLKDMEDDDAFDKAFSAIPTAVESFSDEVLLRGFRRTLPKATRQRIHTALGLIDI